MKKIALIIILGLFLLLSHFEGALKAETKVKQISFVKMRQLIKENDLNYIVLDVRTKEEYSESRIPNSILIPDYEIEKAIDVIKDKETHIFLYCRSGNRTKEASNKLVKLGYKNVYDMGGIINYPYEDIIFN